jgi:hypothetical protein
MRLMDPDGMQVEARVMPDPTGLVAATIFFKMAVDTYMKLQPHTVDVPGRSVESHGVYGTPDGGLIVTPPNGGVIKLTPNQMEDMGAGIAIPLLAAMHSDNGPDDAGPIEGPGPADNPGEVGEDLLRNPAQDKILTQGEIRILEGAGIDIHDVKGNDHTGVIDLYKDNSGNVYIKAKGGKGPGDPTGINLNDYK